MPTDPLLPPGSTVLEHGTAATGANALDWPAPVETLWNPALIPAELLPWLAWSISIDRWLTTWTEAEKRAAIASAIDRQRIKGTPASVRAVLTASNELLELVEWHQTMPMGVPHTFDIRLPASAGLSVEAMEALVADVLRDVSVVQPARSHARFVHLLEGVMSATPMIALRPVMLQAMEATLAEDTSLPWASFIQTRDGAPLILEQGGYLSE